MKILSLLLVENEENFIIFGLSDDNKMYFWDAKEAKWVLYKSL